MLPIHVPVDEFTTPDPVTANEDMTIDDLRYLMEEHGIRHLPVVRGDTVVGVISDWDARLVLGLASAEKLHVRAADIVAVAPLTVRAVGCAEQSEAHRSRLVRFVNSPHPTPAFG
ncbi:CBS domain-containing protein [Methylomonas rapida]|uniref:CBS domain-containing protein n=1 Tax=Methylomonas rapida TaxID=2963939 RepID=A0ABY7GM96_9GAMM|nr:CBS domain-containing protein [Methylomonas rapida]WAR45631.1 CBS domain-containing protein [Methylomonas rapida]